MADTVLYQTDDDLSQENLAASTKRQNAEDYVERGLSLSNYDSGALTVDVSAGHCVISAGSNAAYDVFPDARSGVSLTGSATNSVYVVIDPTAQDDVTVEALDSGTPANPYLKIGEVDTSADTVSDVSRDPDGTFEKVSTAELSSKDIFIRPGEDVQTRVDEAAAASGYRRAVLVGDSDFSVSSPVTVPGGVKLCAVSDVDENGTPKLVPSGDHKVVELDLNSGTSPPRLHNITVDTSGVTGYSSRAVHVFGDSKGGDGEPLMDGYTIHGAPGEGTMLQVDATAGSGISWHQFNGKIFGGDIGIERVARDDAAFVNANQFNTNFFNSTTWITETRATSGAAVGANKDRIRGNGNSQTTQVLDGPYSGIADLHIFDWGLFGSTPLLDVTGSAELNPHIGENSARFNLVTERIYQTRFEANKFDRIKFDRVSVPEYLPASGQGSISIAGADLRVATSGSSGDEVTCSPGEAIFRYTVTDNPALSATVDSHSTSNVVIEFGISNPGGMSSYGVSFAYDPGDNLSDPISTTNWYARVVNPDGSVDTTDTGESSLGRYDDAEVVMLRDNLSAYHTLNGSEVQYVDFSSRMEFTQPFVRVESTEAAVKDIDFWPRFELSQVVTNKD